jgi:ATP-binding cassette, subfamily B, bacterial
MKGIRGGSLQEGGWRALIRYDEQQDKPQFNRELLGRVATYARPYTGRIALMIVSLLAGTLLGLLPPLLYRDLIDNALPHGDWNRLNLLALAMIAVPLARGLLSVADRYLSVRVGEGIIYDLRRALFEHLQGMSLRFFTNTRTGELMSRLNNDVVGSQQALTGTLMSVILNVSSTALTIGVMLSLDWRLTLLSVVVLPAFILPARRVAGVLRRLTREAFDNNAEMNALMNETLNVSGALLVKLFGRAPDEKARFGDRAARVRDIGVRSAVIGRWFFMGLGLASAVGLALVFWIGGQMVLSGAFTIGTLVAFGFYVQQLYGPLAALTNARVELATSLVSFERVFEVLDLPAEIVDRPDAVVLEDVRGEVRFEHVSFGYTRVPDSVAVGLADVRRFRGPMSASAGASASSLSLLSLELLPLVARAPLSGTLPAEADIGPRKRRTSANPTATESGTRV